MNSNRFDLVFAVISIAAMLGVAIFCLANPRSSGLVIVHSPSGDYIGTDYRIFEFGKCVSLTKEDGSRVVIGLPFVIEPYTASSAKTVKP